MNFVIGISMLIASLKVASQLGAAGATAVTGMAKAAGGYVKGKAKGKARAGAKSLYAGTSGEGGIKGGLSRIRAGTVGGASGLSARLVKSVIPGKYGEKMGGTMDKVQMRAQGRETSRLSRKQAFVREKAKAAGIPESQMTKYLGAGVQGRATRDAIADIKGTTGQFDDEKDVLETIKVKERAGDTEGIKKIRKTRADAHDSESAKKLVGDKGVKAFEGLNAGVMEKKKLTGGAKNIVNALLKDDQTDFSDIGKAISKFNKTTQEAIKKEMASIDVSGSTKDKLDEEGKPVMGKDKKIEQVPDDGLNHDGSINRTSPVGKQTLMQLSNPETGQESYEKFLKTPGVDPEKINKGLSTSIDSKAFSKMDPESSLFQAIAKDLKPGKVAGAIKDGNMSADQQKIIVEQQVNAGNIATMMLNPVTSAVVTDKQKKDNKKDFEGIADPHAARDSEAKARTAEAQARTAEAKARTAEAKATPKAEK